VVLQLDAKYPRSVGLAESSAAGEAMWPSTCVNDGCFSMIRRHGHDTDPLTRSSGLRLARILVQKYLRSNKLLAAGRKGRVSQ
jgi:hypothetical protein